MKGVKGRKIISLLLTLAMLAGMLPTAAFAAGDSTEITTEEQLKGMTSGSYTLGADIALSSGWTSLDFSGTLDGNGHKITLNGAPLFGTLSGTVTNLLLDGSVTVNDFTSKGALAVTVDGGTVENCWSGAAVVANKSYYSTGGLTGAFKNNGTISNCLVTGELSGNSASYQNGIATSSNATIKNCFWLNGSKVASSTAGGIIENSPQITADDYTDVMTTLNSNVPDGGKYWEKDSDNIPKPTSDVAPPADKDALNAAITEAQNITEQGKYTTASWTAFQTALTAAKEIAGKDDATQLAVNQALAALQQAKGNLKLDLTTETAEIRGEIDGILAALPKNQLTEDGQYYTADTWNALQKAITAANTALADVSSDSDTLRGVKNGLESAQSALASQPVPQPVTPPEGTGWEEISTADQLKDALESSEQKYYKLTDNIDGFTGATWDKTFGGVLDGNGYVVTLTDGSLAHTIDADAVIQNLGVTGTCSDGAFAYTLKGKLINCWSQASISSSNAGYSGGLAYTMAEGSAIVNCYSTATNVGGIAYSGNAKAYIIYSYWQSEKTYTSSSSASGVELASGKKTEAEMKASAFIDLLNAHKGTNGKTWARSESGYPWQGESVEGETFDYPVVLTDLVSQKTQTSTGPDDLLQTDIFGREDGYAAQLSLDGYEGTVTWKGTYAGSGNSPAIVQPKTGMVYIGSADGGDITVTASDEEGKVLVKVKLSIVIPETYTISLYVDGKDVTNGTVNLTGSEDKRIVPYVTYDKDEPTPVLGNLVTLDSDDKSVLTVQTTGDIWVKATGKAAVTASLGSVSAKTTVHTTYVKIKSIEGNFAGTYYIHGRSPNSIGQNDTPGVASFNPLYNDGSVASAEKIATISPSNASYTTYTMKSSDSTVLKAGEALVNALIPVQPGKVRVTVTTADPNLEAQLSDTTDITLEYLNPLESLTAKSAALTVAEGERVDAGLVFTGPYSDAGSKPDSIVIDPETSTESYEGLHVSESNMTWTQSSTDGGAVTVYRPYPIYMPGDEGYHLYEGSVSMDQWIIEGAKKGTVTLTGTPADKTYTGDPITLTVTVTEGDGGEKLSTKDWVKQAIQKTGGYIAGTLAEAPVFGNEWSVFGLARADYDVPENFYETYYAVAAEQVKAQESASSPWSGKVTDTQRLALALTAIGKDPTNVEGVNLLDYSWNKEAHMSGNALGSLQGSNELIYALLAINAHDSFTQPESVSMSAEQMIGKLLSEYQLADGGFGLDGNQSIGVDITAMAVQALAKYYNSRTDVQAAVDKALERLAAMQDVRGDFGSAEADAQVIVALTELGIDPDNNDIFAVSLVDGLRLYDKGDGTFSHTLTGAGDGMATEQAYYTLAALQRFYGQENSLYDLNDVSFGGDSGTAVTGVVLQPKSGSIRVGGTVQLSATVVPSTAENKNVTWSSAAPAVATVSSSGLVTGVAAGSATITVTTADGGKTASAVITVTETGGTQPGGDGTIMVTMSVDKLTIDKGYVLRATRVEAEAGSTVWDVFQQVMQERGIAYETDISAQYNSVYVKSIDGDGEFDHGPGSGWMFSVNGTYPEIGASAYELEDGDRIQWRYTTNLGADLDNGSNGATAGSGQDDETSGGGAVVLEPSGSVDAQGKAEVSVTETEMRAAIADLKGQSADELVIAPEIKGDAAEIALSLPLDSLSKAAQQTGADLSIETALGVISVPNDAVAAICSAAGGTDVVFTVRAGTAQQAAELLEGKADVSAALLRESAVIGVEVSSNGREIADFGGESVSLYLPVDGERFESGKSYTVYQISGDGTAEKLTGKCVLREDKLYVAVTAERLNTFVVLPQRGTAELPFADVAESDWFYDAVAYAYDNGLFNGTGDTAFSPNGVMTRSMLVTVLWRLEDEPDGAAAADFADVQPGSWYADAAAWACANGIVNGTGTGFDPNGNVTREQVATILYRYAAFKGWDVSADESLSGFADGGETSDWAERAMRWAWAEKLLTGKGSGILDPQGQATRAEIATILMRFCEKQGL